ncbi:MAG: hypothetical protein F7C38_03900 [Desulfurococcales archaeon]|nr:hypothetical protein [Desulfurococcales archaeon]
MIEVRTSDAIHLASALQPDNLAAPPHVAVSCTAEGIYLVCRVTVWGCEDPKRILTLRNTIDDLFYSLKAALEAVS